MSHFILSTCLSKTCLSKVYILKSEIQITIQKYFIAKKNNKIKSDILSCNFQKGIAEDLTDTRMKSNYIH